MKPKIIIDHDVYRKVNFWVQKADSEVSGLGTVHWDKEANAFRVTNAILLQQKNGQASTEIDPQSVCKAMYDLRESQGELRWWWHSHVNMGVFWSGTDNATIAELAQGGWCVATVFNKKKEFKSAYSTTDHMFPIFVDDLDLEISEAPLSEEEIQWAAEYDLNCKKEVPAYSSPTYPISDYNTGWAMRNNVWHRETTTQTTPTIGHGTISEEAIQSALELDQRPHGMAKTEWRARRREYHERLRSYPFSQEELTKLAEYGFDIHEIDYMMSHNYTREEIMACIDPTPISDDVPVYDRRFCGV